MRMRKKLGEVLIESGIITLHELDHALLIQKAKHKRLGKILVELGYVTEQQIAMTLSQQLGIPHVDPRRYTITDEIKALVPKSVAERDLVMPLELTNKTLLLAMADPLDLETIDEITFRTGVKVAVAVTDEGTLIETIERFYSDREKVWEVIKDIDIGESLEFVGPEAVTREDVTVDDLYRSSSAPPVIKLVTIVIANAVKERASDIHVEPREQALQVRYRIDGELKDVHKFPRRIQDAVISRIKIISNLDITNRKLPQDGSTHIRLDGREIDLRISTLPSIYGEKIVMRILDRSTGLIPLAKLGVPPHILNEVITAFSQPQGMLLVTGPTGSGKTTTLYACLNQLKSETENIITVEDPVEYKIEGITQVAVNDMVGLTFATALRSILRQDPDIILVGEIRDLETAEIAIRSALTGHLVLSTLHTNDTVSTIIRLIDLGIPEFLVSSALTGVLAQRLLRKICPHCKVEADPLYDFPDLGVPMPAHTFKGRGCPQCRHSGYQGQIGVYEFLKVSTKLRRLISRKVQERDLWDAAREGGITTLFEDAWQKVYEGITTVEEVLAKIPIVQGEKVSGGSEEERALKALHSAYARDPRDGAVVAELGELLRKRADFEEAVHLYRQFLDVSPQNPDTHFLLGRTYLDMGLIDNAVEHIKKAWEYNPQSGEIITCLKELAKSYRIRL